MMGQEATGTVGGVPGEVAEAVARGGGAVVTLAWPLGKLHLRAKFVGLEAGGTGVWAWLEMPAGPAAQRVGQAVERGESAQVDFRGAGTNYQFTAKLARGEGEPAVVALREIQGGAEVQRRQAYRAAVSEGCAPGVKAWPIPSYAALRDRPLRAQELEAKLVDLSALGMGLMLLPKGGERPAVAVERRVRLMLEGPDGEVLLGGTVKHVAAIPGDGLRVGLEFRQAEYDVKDRQNLGMIPPIISAMQRAEARAMREEADVAAAT